VFGVDDVRLCGQQVERGGFGRGVRRSQHDASVVVQARAGVPTGPLGEKKDDADVISVR
jgi:hypothetical protein